MIGIFDSGIGGLTAVKAIMGYLPGYDLIYFGDTARTPYGTKSRETVINYALEDTNILLNQGAKIIVMACNTASSVATEAIIQKYNVPLFEVITPAVDWAVSINKNNRIGIIGTRATVNSNIYPTKIREKKPDAIVYSKACPLFVPLVEEGSLNKPETTMIIKKYLLSLKTKKIDTLILGCTHYPILKKKIQIKIGRHVTLIDSSEAIATTLKNYIESNPQIEKSLTKNNKTEFYVSDITKQFEITANILLKKKISLKHISL
jgi:glutamate racemase